MKTDQLIKILAADGGERRLDLSQQIAAALFVGFAASAALFVVLLGPRADITAVIGQDPRFALKFVITLALAATAAALVLRLIRPGATRGILPVALVAAPALLALGIGYELIVMPPSTWLPRLIGRNAVVCLLSIPVLAAPVLIALLLVMRRGAPTAPALAGAAAGLVASGLGAALYAAHCVDDSPLFVVTWYGIAIAMVTAAAAAAGARWLRW